MRTENSLFHFYFFIYCRRQEATQFQLLYVLFFGTGHKLRAARMHLFIAARVVVVVVRDYC